MPCRWRRGSRTCRPPWRLHAVDFMHFSVELLQPSVLRAQRQALHSLPGLMDELWPVPPQGLLPPWRRKTVTYYSYYYYYC